MLPCSLFSASGLVPLLLFFGSQSVTAAPLHTTSLSKRADFGQSAGPHFVFSGGPSDIKSEDLPLLQTMKDLGAGTVLSVQVLGYGSGTAEPTVYDTIHDTDAPDAFNRQNILDGAKLDLEFTRLDVDKLKKEQSWGYRVVIERIRPGRTPEEPSNVPVFIDSEHYPIAGIAGALSAWGS